MKEYLTVISSAAGEYTEKRSRFVSGIYHCETEQDAQRILSEVKSANFGANHNVYAYVLKNGSARFSDDSEPHGTAGKPVLEVIEGNALKDVIVVVTRYFGGVLLGTGGLVRSYTTAAQSAVKNAIIVKMCECVKYNIICEYSDHARLVSLIEKDNGNILKTEFTDKVTLTFSFLKCDTDKFLLDLKESFSSRIEANCIKNEILPIKI